MRTRTLKGLAILVVLSFSSGIAFSQTASVNSAAPNSDPVYLQLRKVALGAEAITVRNTVLKRDAGMFTFSSGTICFLAPVQGKVTGAVFMGNGSFKLEPPLSIEKRQLSLLTVGPSMNEEFNDLVMRFTDDTYDLLKKANGVTSGGGTCSAGTVSENQDILQHNLHYNLSARVLQDVLSDTPGGFFMAFIKGKNYSSKLVYVIDPHGVPRLPGQVWNPGVGTMPPMDVSPEEVALLTWDPNEFGIWAAFHLANEYATGKASDAQENGWIDIEKHEIDASFDRAGRMTGKSTITFLSLANGLRVVPLDLFPTLRVDRVSDAAGQPLPFIQEDKDNDPQFFVILPKALAAGEKLALTTTYSGKDAVQAEGVGNYYPIARSNWYPNSRAGDYATYDIRFAIPKGMSMAATGKRISEETEGDLVVSRWASEQPQTVAGFQFGKFKRATAALNRPPFAIESFANTEPPDFIRDLQSKINLARQGNQLARQELANEAPSAMDVVDTTAQIQNAIADAQMAVPLYTDYFGPVPFTRLAITQQTATNYGQSWPGLVWLPISYFWDSTIRHQVGLDDPKGYFTVVGPHEIAHQWFGHAVTWRSYRDQWMSEGFSELAASIYLHRFNKDPQPFIKFWNDEKELLLITNAQGYRAVDFPLTLGLRTVNTKTGEGSIYRRLVYPKGGYVLHMLRMMMWDRTTVDQAFKEMMQDFVKTYTNRSATTEDFKAIVEKHMTPAMDLAGNHRMDWFFDEYVYGTALPHYKLEYSFTKGADGSPILTFKLTQSGVGENFVMTVPLYLDMGKNGVIRMGSANMFGNKTIEKQVPLAGLKETPKRLVVGYYDDVLGVIDK